MSEKISHIVMRDRGRVAVGWLAGDSCHIHTYFPHGIQEGPASQLSAVGGSLLVGLLPASLTTVSLRLMAFPGLRACIRPSPRMNLKATICATYPHPQGPEGCFELLPTYMDPTHPFCTIGFYTQWTLSCLSEIFILIRLVTDQAVLNILPVPKP